MVEKFVISLSFFGVEKEETDGAFDGIPSS